jgi:hypothetical protein
VVSIRGLAHGSHYVTVGVNKKGDLLELCKALIAYSDSAKAYFIGS